MKAFCAEGRLIHLPAHIHRPQKRLESDLLLRRRVSGGAGHTFCSAAQRVACGYCGDHWPFRNSISWRAAAWVQADLNVRERPKQRANAANFVA